MFIQTLATASTAKVRTGWPYRWFWKFFQRFTAKAHACFDLSEYWMIAICIAKLWNTAFCCPRSVWYKQCLCFTSDVMCEWYKRLVYTHPDSLARLVERKKFGRNFFPGLINQRWSRAIMTLNKIEDDCQFLGVHMRLSTRCKIWFSLGLFARF